LRVPRNENGFVLVTVLMIIAVLLPAVIIFTERVQTNLEQAENFKNSIQASRIARGGVEGAASILAADDTPYDSSSDKWAQELPPLPTPQGVLTLKIGDEDGKFPVNLLINSNGIDNNQDIATRLRALVARVGGKPEIVDALIDWMDADDIAFGTAGAETEYYTPLGYQAKNSPLSSIDELLYVKGFDKDLLYDKGLAKLLTAAVTDGKVNLNTARAEVLHAVLGTQSSSFATPWSESDVEDLVRYRESTDLKSVSDANGAVKVSGAQAAAIPAVGKVNSTFFHVRSSCAIGKMTRTVDAILKRDNQNVATISWRER
jgi:general secretion pathway protein K